MCGTAADNTPLHNRPPIGRMIRAHREATKMTAAALAKRVGLSRNTIMNYESGKTEPSASDLVKLAEALGCRVVDLLGVEDVPQQPRFAFRAHAPLRRNPSIIVLARKFLRAYRDIEEITDKRLPDHLRPFVCRTTGPLNEQDIEARAEDLRQRCGISDCGPENIARVLESLGVRCLFFGGDLPGLDAVSAIEGDMTLVMLKDSKKNVERIIFSGAHELGHLVLHPLLFTTDSSEGDLETDFEKEANHFAGCFLVPSHELNRVWRVDRLERLPPFRALLILKRVFHVSYWCLFHRAKHLGLVAMGYPQFVNHTKACLGIKGRASIKDLEPDPLDGSMIYRTTRFENLVRSAFVQDRIGVAKVAEMLQVSVEDALAITAQWLHPPCEPRNG